MNRRAFLGQAGLSLVAAAASETIPGCPIIDCHIHLFDPGRKQGVPWPPKDNAVLYKRAMPDRYRKIAVPLGVKGAIEVECSPWVDDNQWVLDVAAADKIMVGTVGNLEPGKPEFARQLERLAKNRLFRGIRYGTLWGRPFSEDVKRPEFVEGVKRLAGAKLTLDSATASSELLGNLIRLTDAVPELKVVIDHLPQMEGLEKAERELLELAKRPPVFVKVSEVLRRVNGKVPEDLAFYRPRLDQLFGVFGADRLLYGSDWPNSDQWAEYPVMLRIVTEYFSTKGREAVEKYFWKNSVRAYGWVRRGADQPK